MIKNINDLTARVKEMEYKNEELVEKLEVLMDIVDEFDNRLSTLEQVGFEEENNVRGFEGQDD
jgi:hypothetical protein